MWFYISYFPLRAPVQDTWTYLDVYVSIISHISSAWSRSPNHYSFQDRVSLTLHSENIEYTGIEYLWPHWPCLSWAPLITPIMEVCWAYSWMEWFTHSETSGSILLGQFIKLWNLSAWYLEEWVHPHYSKGELTLPVALVLYSSATLMHTAAVFHLVFLVSVEEGNGELFWSIQEDVFYDIWISPPKAMSTIGACSHLFS